MAQEEMLKVALYDYDKFKKVLKQAEPDTFKKMNNEIRGFIKPVSSLAKQYVPKTVMSGWKPRSNDTGKRQWGSVRAWDPEVVAKGIGVYQGGTRAKGSALRSAWRISNKSAAGSIYELAGKKHHGSNRAGRVFIKTIMERGGRPSRLIYRAWDDKGGSNAITRDVANTIERYQIELSNKLS